MDKKSRPPPVVMKYAIVPPKRPREVEVREEKPQPPMVSKYAVVPPPPNLEEEGLTQPEMAPMYAVPPPRKPGALKQLLERIKGSGPKKKGR